MDEPREVTGPTGTKRWVASDGRSYATLEEAREASREAGWRPLEAELETEKPQSRASYTIENGIFMAGFTALAIGVPYYAFTGDLHFKSEWLWLLVPLGWFAIVGMALQFGSNFYAGLMGRHEDVESEAVWDWWMGEVGCGILIFIVGAVVLYLIYAGIADEFEDISKGTGIIIFLLFCILLALIHIGSQRRQ